MPSNHLNLTADRGIHAPWTFEYANTSDRNNHLPALGPKDPQTNQYLLLADMPAGILCCTQDNFAIHKLTNPAAGTWTEVGGATGGPPDPHQASHTTGGSDVIDADELEVSVVPSNYTRDNTPPEASAVTSLAAHLQGISNALGTIPLAPTYCELGLLVNSPLATNATFIDIPFDVARRDEADTSANTTTGVITISTTGTYEVFADITWAQTTGNNRTSPMTRIQHNLSGGGFTTMLDSERRGYSRQNAHGNGNTTVSGKLVDFTAGDTVKCQIAIFAGSGDVAALAGHCLFKLKRVR